MLRLHPAEKSQGFSHLVEVHLTLHQTRKSLGIVHLVPEKSTDLERKKSIRERWKSLGKLGHVWTKSIPSVACIYFLAL